MSNTTALIVMHPIQAVCPHTGPMAISWDDVDMEVRNDIAQELIIHMARAEDAIDHARETAERRRERVRKQRATSISPVARRHAFVA